jgi:hypothetical protein
MRKMFKKKPGQIVKKNMTLTFELIMKDRTVKQMHCGGYL